MYPPTFYPTSRNVDGFLPDGFRWVNPHIFTQSTFHAQPTSHCIFTLLYNLSVYNIVKYDETSFELEGYCHAVVRTCIPCTGMARNYTSVTSKYVLYTHMNCTYYTVSPTCTVHTVHCTLLREKNNRVGPTSWPGWVWRINPGKEKTDQQISKPVGPRRGRTSECC